MIFSVAKSSGAAKAGLRPTKLNRYREVVEYGDLIIAVDGVETPSSADLILALEKYQPGDEVLIKFIRDGEEIEQLVTLGSSVG